MNRYGLFVNQGLSPVDAAAAVSQSFSDSGQRFAALAVEKRILQGMSLGNAIAQSTLSDSLCRPVLRMLDYRGPNLARSLEETSSILQQLADRRCRSLSAIDAAVGGLCGRHNHLGNDKQLFAFNYSVDADDHVPSLVRKWPIDERISIQLVDVLPDGIQSICCTETGRASLEQIVGIIPLVSSWCIP